MAEGQGVIDNWSGAFLLPSLFESLSATPRTLTFVFLLTIDEEKGLYGSTDYVRLWKKEQVPSIVANVNVDSLGLAGPTYVWPSREGMEVDDRDLLQQEGRESESAPPDPRYPPRLKRRPQRP